MTCPHCGADVAPGNTFCHRCRKRVVAPGGGGAPASKPTPPPSRPMARPQTAGAGGAFRRPGGITVLAVLNTMAGLACLAIFGFNLVAMNQTGLPTPAMVIAVAAAFAVLGLLYVASGVGLFTLRGYGRVLTLVLAGVGALGLATLPASILIFVYLLKPGMAILFSGRSAATLSAQERADVEAATSSKLGLVIAALTVLPCVAVGSIVAAIAIPSLLRARVVASESAAIGDLRALVSAQAAYQSASQGVYATAECLPNPQACMPTYQGPAFWTTGPVEGTRRGYVFKLHPGAAWGTGLGSYAYTAEPLTPGQTGIRRFCADDTGVVWTAPDPSYPLVKEGRCFNELQPLR